MSENGHDHTHEESRHERSPWAARIRAWSTGGQPNEDGCWVSPQAPPARTSRDVYCYFDNDIKVHAPYDALRLIKALGLDQS